MSTTITFPVDVKGTIKNGNNIAGKTVSIPVRLEELSGEQRELLAECVTDDWCATRTVYDALHHSHQLTLEDASTEGVEAALEHVLHVMREAEGEVAARNADRAEKYRREWEEILAGQTLYEDTKWNDEPKYRYDAFAPASPGGFGVEESAKQEIDAEMKGREEYDSLVSLARKKTEESKAAGARAHDNKIAAEKAMEDRRVAWLREHAPTILKKTEAGYECDREIKVAVAKWSRDRLQALCPDVDILGRDEEPDDVDDVDSPTDAAFAVEQTINGEPDLAAAVRWVKWDAADDEGNYREPLQMEAIEVEVVCPWDESKKYFLTHWITATPFRGDR